MDRVGRIIRWLHLPGLDGGLPSLSRYEREVHGLDRQESGYVHDGFGFLSKTGKSQPARFELS